MAYLLLEGFKTSIFLSGKQKSSGSGAQQTLPL